MMKAFVRSLRILLSVVAIALTARAYAADVVASPKQPQVVGPWWRIAGDPDLGELTNRDQQPVDFGVWQAADGTWQLLSCIRNTKEHGKTRLLYRWEGAKLTDKDWKPIGIAMRADSKCGELEGGLQAPFVFRDGKRFEMFYGGWNDICSASSDDGKTFQRNLNAEGKTTLFGAPTGNTRDPMVFRIGDLWHCYYTAHPENKGADYCRTSRDLLHWSDARVVAKGGQAGNGPSSAECPFVVELDPGEFYLFRTQAYGQNAKTSVYYSRDPLDFGIDHDEGHFVCTLPVAAPEIIKHDGQYYIAALLPSLKGIQITRLEWGRTAPPAGSEPSPTSRWEKEVQAFEAADAKSPPPKGAVLFIGSSTIRLWKTLAKDFPDQKVVNRGFGGSEIADCTALADRIVIPYQPAAIFLRSGSNDLNAGKSPEQVAADFKAFVAKVRAKLPDVEIVYISLCPSIARAAQAEKTKTLNALIETFLRDVPLTKYIDSYDLAFGPDGKLRPELFAADKLHFNAAGYKLLAARVRPYLPAPTTKSTVPADLPAAPVSNR